MNAVIERLADGRWRVTDAAADWVDDGRDYPQSQDSDRIYAHQDDAIRDYLERTTPRDPSDDITDAGVDAWRD